MRSMKPVGWAYWLNDHWHLCADEPTAHKERQLVYLAKDVKELEDDRERYRESLEYLMAEWNMLEATTAVSRTTTVDLVAEVMRRAPICPRDNIPMLGLASSWFFCTVCRRTVDFDDDGPPRTEPYDEGHGAKETK